MPSFEETPEACDITLCCAWKTQTGTKINMYQNAKYYHYIISKLPYM